MKDLGRFHLGELKFGVSHLGFIYASHGIVELLCLIRNLVIMQRFRTFGGIFDP